MSDALLVIDAQVDFCDPTGALYVLGAHRDMARVAQWLRRESLYIQSVFATLDSHHLVDIAHPAWWHDAEGRHPVPFTPITANDVREGAYRAAAPKNQEGSLRYVEALEQAGKKTLFVWPPHCLVGHPGHALYPEIAEAFDEWEFAHQAQVNFVWKGLDPFTEHYSAVRPESASDEGLNVEFIRQLDQFDRIIVVGEALSHCVADTVTDLLDQISPEKFVLLTDGMSPVSGFEALGETFLREASKKGATLSTTVHCRLAR